MAGEEWDLTKFGEKLMPLVKLKREIWTDRQTDKAAR